MNKKLKLDIIGLISSVVLICLCIAAIVITLISGLGTGLTLAIVLPYVIIIGFSLFFVWKFIEAIYLESEEEKRAKYEAYIKAQEQQLASQPQFVSQSQINSATEHQAHIGTEQKEKALYYKVVCEKCGHIAYVKAEDVWDANK